MQKFIWQKAFWDLSNTAGITVILCLWLQNKNTAAIGTTEVIVCHMFKTKTCPLSLGLTNTSYGSFPALKASVQKILATEAASQKWVG